MAQGFTGNAVVQVMPTLTSDAGTATASGNNINVLGGTLIDTAGATDTLTINADSTVIASVASDSGTATGATNAITVTGTGGITTSGSGSTLTVDGSGVSGTGGTLVNMATTSGTSVTFTSLPATVKTICMSFNNISNSGANAAYKIQLGDSGGIETTGYGGYSRDLVGATNNANSTYFYLNTTSLLASASVSGNLTFVSADSTNLTWTVTGVFYASAGTNPIFLIGGDKTLTSALTDIKLYFTGGSAFDSGSVSIVYYS